MKVRLALPLAGFLLTACTVVNPPGWDTRSQEPDRITFDPAQSTLIVPASELWPAGREILFEVDQMALTHGMGLYSAEIEFTLGYRDAPSETLRCRHEPAGPGVPQARFGCWTDADARQRVAFWLAPGLDCPTRNVGVMRTLTTPACWTGELRVDERNVNLAHGYLKRAGSPVGQISWVSTEGAPLLAVDITRTRSIELYDLDPAMRDDIRQPLVLLSVALAWYEHALSPD